jgi:hypothetical protein
LEFAHTRGAPANNAAPDKAANAVRKARRALDSAKRSGVVIELFMR